MNRVVVINVVGLTSAVIGGHTPFIKKWLEQKSLSHIKPVLPAVTCSAQATYLTGKLPSEHGIVGNGWYFKNECEVKFWRQSNRLVQAKKIWEYLKEQSADFTCANMFWWYNMYSHADYSVTPRPQYHADGVKLPDCYSHPAQLRDELQKELGVFPLFEFWGPRTSIKSTKWIANASMMVEEKYHPTLTLIYLPHLDYNFQRYGSLSPQCVKDLVQIDEVCEKLIKFYERKGVEVILLSEYGITPVSNPVHLNRILRKNNLVAIREEGGLELLDAGASKVFAVADHQLAHIYVNEHSRIHEVKTLLQKVQGIEMILADEVEKTIHGLNHQRAGDIICVAGKDSWFTYYYWLDDSKAPDFARTVEIHRKPGYDPVELFIDPQIKFPLGKVAGILAKKKLGFRYLMDVIPLDATLVKGSHGRIPESKDDWPVIIARADLLNGNSQMPAADVFKVIRNAVVS